MLPTLFVHYQEVLLKKIVGFEKMCDFQDKYVCLFNYQENPSQKITVNSYFLKRLSLYFIIIIIIIIIRAQKIGPEAFSS